MKKMVLMAVMMLLLSGCSGIIADARHSALIDTTAAASVVIADKAMMADGCDSCVGEWTRDEVKKILQNNALLWSYFMQAKGGNGEFPTTGLLEP